MPKLGLNVNVLSLLADNHGRRNIKSETKQNESSTAPTYFSFVATATYKKRFVKLRSQFYEQAITYPFYVLGIVA